MVPNDTYLRDYLLINNVTGISVSSATFYFSLFVPGKRGFLYTSLFQRCFTYGTRLKEQKMPKSNEWNQNFKAILDLMM